MGNRLAVDLICPASEVLEVGVREGEVRALREGERLAVVQGLQQGQALLVFLDQLSELKKLLATLLPGHTRPRPLVKGLAGGGDGLVDIPLSGRLEVTDLRLCAGVDALEGLPLHGILELPVDDQLREVRRHTRGRGCDAPNAA